MDLLGFWVAQQQNWSTELSKKEVRNAKPT